MSETATTIIKLMSGLTSPKAAVKYISIAIFIVISWKFISELARSFGTPNEHVSIVVLLAGVGLGSIIGQIITWLGESIWQVINRRIVTKRIANKVIKEKSEDDRKTASENDALLQKYTKSFAHLDWRTQETLRELTLRGVTLDFSNLSFKALYENKYIEVISEISHNTYLVALNPVLTEETKITWEKKIKENVDDYFLEMTAEKSRVLELMEFREKDDDSIISFDIGPVVLPFGPCIRIEGEDATGFWLTFRSYYPDEFSKRTGKDYIDETWIDRDRIVLSKGSEA